MENMRHKIMEGPQREFRDGVVPALPGRDRLSSWAQSEKVVPTTRPGFLREAQSPQAGPASSAPSGIHHSSGVRSAAERPTANAGNAITEAVAPPVPMPAPITSPTSITTKDWTLSGLLENSNFQLVHRVSIHDELWPTKADEAERQGIPLIVEGWHTDPRWCGAFDADRLVAKDGDTVLSARNVQNYKDIDMTLSDFVEHSRTTSRFTTGDPPLYAKDVDCPQEWRDWLYSDVIPPELQPGGSKDLLAHLPHSERVETIMCYYGIGDTFTPCHKDLCGSTGHNLMCHTEDGSSFWFMTASDVAPEVAKYFQETLGQELDWENHATTIDELRDAPFPVYVAEQKLGDLFIIPPRSCHQVVNHGGLTMKLSWSRITVKGLTTALLYELPIYRRVCRPEIYRTKSVLHHSLRHYTKELESVAQVSPSEARRMTRDTAVLDLLVSLFDGVLREEYGEPVDNVDDGGAVHNVRSQPPPTSPSSRSHAANEQPCTFACDFCGADIFQSYFKCDSCCQQQNRGDCLVICSTCYVEGRTCKCTNMVPTQRCKTQDLINDRNRAVRILRQLGAGEDSHTAVLTPRELKDSDDVCVFQAACALRVRRAEFSSKLHEMRSCRSNLSPPHSVSYLSSLYCLGCHYSSCLMHLLDTGIHASEVFLAIHKDLGKADYSQLHQTHLHAKTQFGNVKPALTGVEKTGVFAPQAARLGARLVLAAQRFRHCRAVNSVFTSPGFYDYEVSPREPVDAPAPDCNAPENTKHENAMDISRSQTPALGSPRAQSPEIPLRHSLAQIEESSPADGVMSQEHFAQTHIDDARFDTLTAARSVTEPPQRHNRAYILLSGPASGSSKRKRDAAATSEQTSRRKRVKASKPQEEDFVDDDYGGALVNVMQSAYNQAQDSQRPGPNKFKRVARRVDSPDPEPEDPIPRGRRDDPQGSRLPSARPRQRSGRDLVDPDRETMRSASKKAKPKSRRPEPCPEPTTGTASQQLTSARDNPIAQSSKASTTGNRALIRAPRGKPPGMPASDCDALPQTTHTHRSTPRTHAGRGRDQTHLDSTEPLSELRAQLRQSEAKRIRLEEDKSRIEDKLAESVHDLTTSRSDYDKLHSECDKFRSERDKFRSERDKFRLERDKYRLECDKLRSECDKLRSERDMDNHRYSDHRKEVGHYKAMSELVEGKLHNAQEALKSKDRQIEDQRRDVEGYKEGLQYLANEFETYLRSHGALQHPSGVPDHMQPMYHQLRQFTDLIGGLITKATQRLPIGSFSEAQPLFLVGNQHGVNTSSPGIVIQSQRVGRDDQWGGGQPEDSNQPPAGMRQGWYGGPNGQGGRGRRLPNRGQPYFRGRGNYLNASPNRPHPRQPYPASGDHTRKWVTNANSQAPEYEGGQSSSSHRPLHERLQSSDGDRSGPIPTSVSLPRRGPSQFSREPSTFSARGPPESDRDQSREATPARHSERSPSTWPRPAESVTESHAFWEDTYDRDEKDDGEISVQSSSLSSVSSASGSESREAHGPDSSFSDTASRSDTGHQSQSQSPDQFS